MVPAFRYHVVTLVAIFLALGVGMAIGSSFVQGAVVRTMTNEVAGLKAQYNSSVAVSEEANRRYAQFVSEAGPLLTQGRLSGSRVAIVQTGDYPDTARQVREALVAAGATVPATLVVPPAYPTRSAVVLPKLMAQLQSIHPGLPQDGTAPLRVIAAALAHGAQDRSLATIVDAGLVEADGADTTVPCDYVVLVGGAAPDADSRADTVDVPLIAHLKAVGLPAIEVEPLDAGTSYVPALRGSEIATVDNADTDIGRVSVVLALRSERGNYGVKPTAQSGILPVPTTIDARIPAVP